MSAESLAGECRLDPAGLRAQRDRYRALGSQAEEIARGHESLVVRFGPGLDHDLLEETIAVEQRCCPFFDFGYSDQRVLRISVAQQGQVPALDALESALAA